MKQPKRSLRAIDQGTRYDITGLLRRQARAIERGEHGHITDAVLITRDTDGRVRSFHFGTNSAERSHWMAATVANRMEPA